MLSKGDYSQQDIDIRKRFLLHKNDSWRNFFTTNQRRKEQEKIIQIIDSITIQGDLIKELEALANSYLLAEIKDWKYYFVKYDNQLHFSNTQGYYFWKNRVTCPLEILILNSSFESTLNIEWNIFNKILHNNNQENTSLVNRGASPLIIFKAGVSLNAIQSGLEVKATNDHNVLYMKLIDEKIISEEGLFSISENEDFVEKGQELINKLNTLLINKNA